MQSPEALIRHVDPSRAVATDPRPIRVYETIEKAIAAGHSIPFPPHVRIFRRMNRHERRCLESAMRRGAARG